MCIETKWSEGKKLSVQTILGINVYISESNFIEME
jgi:hypothetical protein